MKKFKQQLIRVSYGAYLGGILGFFDISVLSYEFYIILIPTVILAETKVLCYEKG